MTEWCRAFPGQHDEVHPGAILPCYLSVNHDGRHTWEVTTDMLKNKENQVPAVRDYEVVQERRVKVRAENPTHAIEIAKPAFDAGHVDSSYPDIIGDPRETSIEAREDF